MEFLALENVRITRKSVIIKQLNTLYGERSWLLIISCRYHGIALSTYSRGLKLPYFIVTITSLINHCLLFPFRSDKLVALRSKSSTNLRHPCSPRIIESEDIKNVTSDSHRFLEDSKAVNPDEVSLSMRVKYVVKGKLLSFRLSPFKLIYAHFNGTILILMSYK